MGLNISPSVWQSYISAILDCLQSKKYCEAIMDDHLLFYIIKRCSYGKVGRLSKGTTKEWIENIPKEVSII